MTPAFEALRAGEQIQIGNDVRAWQEDESPYALLAAILKDRGAATGTVGAEERLPFVFVDGLAEGGAGGEDRRRDRRSPPAAG